MLNHLKSTFLPTEHHYPCLAGRQAFGMMMLDRQWSSESGYRFGFQGQELEAEINGKGNSYSADYWQYDPRLGKRWNTDPYQCKYPNFSPYSTFENNPILFVDVNGDTTRIYLTKDNKNIPFINISTDVDLDYFVAISSFPDEIQSMLSEDNIREITITNKEIVDLFNLQIAPYDADGKMASISLSGAAFIAGQAELDIINLNRGDDKGKTFLYLSFGLGFGAATPDLSFVKGKLNYNPDGDEMVEAFTAYNRKLFNGWSIQSSWSIGLASGAYVESYGVEDPECFFGCDYPKAYDADLKGSVRLKKPSRIILQSATPGLGILRTQMYSVLLGELPIQTTSDE